MPLSRLRLRLAAAFAIAFALGLGALTAGVLAYLWWQADRRLDARLVAVTNGAVQALKRELAETPDSSIAYAASEVVDEWPANDDSFLIVDERGTPVASADRAHAADSLLTATARTRDAARFTFTHGGDDFHAFAATPLSATSGGHSSQLRVIAFANTEGIERDTELLAGVLALAAPLIVLVSLAGGYVLARRALKPVSDLRSAIGAIVPGDLAQRVDVTHPKDEIGALAMEFNALLARLDDAQRRNRGFVREAAHQIRTPLTLVLGEAGNALAKPGSPTDDPRALLTRIQMAAQQMQRRVNELSLLADAQAGVVVRLDESVELDGLVLECTDLMRARVAALGRALAIGRADHVIVRANAPLLREALVELIENAARHGTSAAPITVSSHDDGAMASIVVESAGEPFSLQSDAGPPEGLGLPIVVWIARAHGGELRVSRDGDRNVAAMVRLGKV